MIKALLLLCLYGFSANIFAQRQETASFVAKLGVDTVIVETYTILPNHLYGKAYLRYPEDRIGIFDFHFYPDGSIKHYSMSYMNAENGFRSSAHTEGLYCEADTCTWFASSGNNEKEYTNKRPSGKMDFIGGWTPVLSLIEWNCMRLIRSGKQSLPLTMINDYIGIKEISVSKLSDRELIFGGDFLEYAKIKIRTDGSITSYDGTGTPWNYTVTRQDPIDIEATAKRMSEKPKIGIPSPGENVNIGFGADTITLNYGRPYKRGRVIFGGIVPYDSVWRTGANGPTILTIPFDARFGNKLIPKGKYALYTIPGREGWSLIFNRNLQKWPTEPDRSMDYATVPLKIRKPASQTDQFTIKILPQKKNSAEISFTWDYTEAYASFEILR